MTNPAKPIEPTDPSRIQLSRDLRDVGPLNWLICSLGARAIRAPQFHLWNALSRHPLLFWSWLPFSGLLLYRGKLSRRDTEMVVLRVGDLRDCEYELQHHRRLARSCGLDDAFQAKIFQGPSAQGLTDRQRTLLTATDEFVLNRTVSEETWTGLSKYLNTKQLVEFCLLAGQYDALAATMNTLKLPLDHSD